MRCPKCGVENPAGKKFCGDCGEPLANLCPKCGSDNPPGKRFCGECGAGLGAPAPASTRKSGDREISVTETVPSGDFEGERKTVTALFADIKGSMDLMEDLDPEEARGIVDPALRLMIDAAHRYDGYIVQSTGDGIFALFGAPVAHEDHPQRALYAALRMQEEMRRYSDKLLADGRAPLEIRVGVNTGEVVVRTISTGGGNVEYTPIGHTTNLASRMQALAPTGSIAISENTRKLVEGYFGLKARGPTRVKGVTEPVNVYEVTGLGPLRTRLQRSVGRGLTKFVGREREMEAMRNASELARAGRGQIVAAMAEAGTGKSRLFFEFKAKNQSGWMVLETFSVSHGKASAYFPVIDLLHGYFEITGEDDGRRRRQKILGKLLELDRTLEDTVPYLYALLGIVEGEDPLAQMDGQVRKRRTLDAIKRILLRESLNQPLMVVFEDLHWIDNETQAFLNLLADSIGTAKILLLVNYRPEYSHQWNSKTYYTQLRLDPLGKESADEMLAALLSLPLARSVTGEGKPGEQPGAGEGAGSMAALKRLIIEKTEGNPFFMEETVQVLLDEGALVRDGATVTLTKPIAELKIPPTVQGILAARIDRLQSGEKDLLQTLAVIGREFSLSLIRAVVPKSEDELNRMLNDLQLGEFIYEQPAVGDTEYIFKHALTQEVSYNSMLMERRKRMHERIGAALEALNANSLDDHLAQLAHHYGRSNNAEKAVDYLRRAAKQAATRSAFSEALAQARAGLALISNLQAGAERDRREFDLLSTLVAAAPASEGYILSPYTESYLRILELARKSGDDHALLTALQAVWLHHQIAGRHREEAEVAEQIVEVAGRINSPGALADAFHAKGSILFWTGRAADALDELTRAIEVCADGVGRVTVDSSDPLVTSLSWAALCAWQTGHSDRAVNLADSAVKRARDLNQQFSRTFAIWTKGKLHSWRGETSETRLVCDQLGALTEENGFSGWLAFNRILHGWVLSVSGEHDRAIEQVRRGIADWRNSFVLTEMNSVLAGVCMRAGRYREAMAAVAAGREHAQRTGEGFGAAELERIAGETFLLMGVENSAEAEQCMRRAIAIAKEQGAKAWELRATTSLARLLRDTSRRDDARTMLAEIYNWFTEGFDITDLKDAKALLAELRA